MPRKRVFVTGLVQGVAYRANLFNRATRLGVKGWVRNRSGGGVEAVLDGDDAALTELIEWCKKGPRSARVRDVQVQDESIDAEELAGFEVRPTL
jgi:acylphosphatase